jgi:CheY-like chemotaxis protein
MSNRVEPQRCEASARKFWNRLETCIQVSEQLMLRTTPMIIVVETQPFINELICEILTDEGYIAIGYVSADEAYAIITKGYSDLVILDLRLGGDDAGLSLLKKLRMQPLTKETLVIMCSYNSNRLNALQEDLQGLHCATLEKPFDISDLVTAVQRSLAGSFEYTYE